MMPTLHDGDSVLVDLGRRAPTPPGIFVLHDGMGLVAKRLEHIPNSDPPRVSIISDNPLYKPYEGSGEEVNIMAGYAGLHARCDERDARGGESRRSHVLRGEVAVIAAKREQYEDASCHYPRKERSPTRSGFR